MNHSQNDSSTQHLTVSLAMAGMRLDKVLVELFPDYSRSRLQAWLKENRVTINGKFPEKSNQKVKANDLITLTPGDLEHMREVVAQNMSLTVVGESINYWVIDKPANLVVHPAPGHWSGTLMNGLLSLDAQLRDVPRAGIVHRLDKDTTGLMVVARNAQAQVKFIQMLQARIVKRVYLALVWGKINHPNTVNKPIGRDVRNRLKMATNDFGKPAVTHFYPISFGSLHSIPVTLMVCKLETGRTHQIRVHAQHAGFSLVGDPVYKPTGAGSSSVLKAATIEMPNGQLFNRQCLHAVGLSFPDVDQFNVDTLGYSPQQWQQGLAEMTWHQFKANLPEDFTYLANWTGIDLSTINRLDQFESDCFNLPSSFTIPVSLANLVDEDDFDENDTETIYVRDDE